MAAQLTVRRGALYLGENILIVRRSGDIDTIAFPFTERGRNDLANALYDEFEYGNLAERTVILPDGSRFNIDANM